MKGMNMPDAEMMQRRLGPGSRKPAAMKMPSKMPPKRMPMAGMDDKGMMTCPKCGLKMGKPMMREG